MREVWPDQEEERMRGRKERRKEGQRITRSVKKGTGTALRTMGKIAVLSLAVLFAAAVNAVTYYFVTPPKCDPNVIMADQFLLNSTTVKTRAMCARECAYNSRCTSLAAVGDHPNVQCKLYEQIINRYGLHLSPSPDSTYLEKTTVLGGSYRPTWACSHESFDAGGACDKRENLLVVGYYLLKNEFMCSTNLQYRATMQQDGNFVVSETSSGNVVWSTATTGQPSHRARLLESGQLVIEDVDGNPLYSTTNSGQPKYMRLIDSGKLQVLSRSNEIIWSSA